MNHPVLSIFRLLVSLSIAATVHIVLPPYSLGEEQQGSDAGAISANLPDQSAAPVSPAVYRAAQNVVGSRTDLGSWVSLPASEAQCTPGARAAGHHASVRISTFGKNAFLAIETLSSPTAGAVRAARQTYPNASYIGNGPIFMESGQPNGYVKSQGKVLSPLDCVNFRNNPGNLGRQNSIFVRYHPRNPPPGAGYQSTWKYRVVSTEFLCQQLQPASYVNWLQSTRSDDIQAHLKSTKKWETDGEDLVEGGQIDFAIQSGPAVLREGQELLADYNSGTGYRSYIGVGSNGEPLAVEADGNIGSYCLGHYLRSRGVRDLLHRDSFISDANFRENNGAITGYPTANSNARAASILIISP